MELFTFRVSFFDVVNQYGNIGCTTHLFLDIVAKLLVFLPFVLLVVVKVELYYLLARILRLNTSLYLAQRASTTIDKYNVEPFRCKCHCILLAKVVAATT